MMNRTWTGRVLSAALLAGVLGGCDFADPGARNPNTVNDPSLDQLFTSVQVGSYALTEGQLSRLAAMWTQQVAGVANQFSGYDVYFIEAEDTNADWLVMYGGGGLVDIREAIARAEELGRRPYAGVLRIHEAYLMGTAAAAFGDVPYSQAARPEYEQPELDEQADVYSAVISLLDQAIADLGSSTAASGGPGATDFNFGNITNPAQQYAAWATVARTLKARYHLHMAEAGGLARYQAALTAAEGGVQHPSGDWKTIHSPMATEQNLWFQFLRDRVDHIVGGHFLINMLNNGTPGVMNDDDPRLGIFFVPARGPYQGTFRGSKPGLAADDPETQASPVRNAPGAPAGEASSLAIAGCAENAGIAAEAAYRLGQEDKARFWLGRLLLCESQRWGVPLGAPPGLTGPALLNEIMRQKYIALFLNPEAWNDYKRTCLPDLNPVPGQRVPGRLLYPAGERAANTNIPAADPALNDNDPLPCRLGTA